MKRVPDPVAFLFVVQTDDFLDDDYFVFHVSSGRRLSPFSMERELDIIAVGLKT